MYRSFTPTTLQFGPSHIPVSVVTCGKDPSNNFSKSRLKSDNIQSEHSVSTFKMSISFTLGPLSSVQLTDWVRLLGS